MSYTTSGSVSFSGLSGSDTDFTAMIGQLKTLESFQKNRLTLWQADWNKRIDAFQQLNTAMLSLNSTLNSMNTMNKFLLKNATVSNPDIMNAVATGEAQNSSNKVQVNKLASNAAYTWEGSKFSSVTDKANSSDKTEDFVYTYKGKTVKVAIGAGASMQQLVNQINSDANNPGVRASLVKDGSEYVFQFQGKDTGASATLTIDPSSSDKLAIKPPVETNTASATKFSAADAVVNDTTASKSFKYTRAGFPFTITVEPGETLQQLATKIGNGDSGVTASVVKVGKDFVLQIEPNTASDKLSLSSDSELKIAFTTDGTAGGTGWDSMDNKLERTSSDLRFDSVNRTINSSGSARAFRWTDSKSPPYHEIMVPPDDLTSDPPKISSLKDLAKQINDAGTSTRAEIIKDEGGYYLQLTELNPSATTTPTIDASSSELLAINKSNTTTPNWATETESYTSFSQGFKDKDAVINTSNKEQIFKYSFDGKTYEVPVPIDTTLEQLVAKINANTHTVDGVEAKTAVEARISIEGTNGYRLQLLPADANSTKRVTLASDSSSSLQIAPPKADWKTVGNTTTYGKTFGAATDVINNSGASQNFTFIDGSGVNRTVPLATNATLQDLIDGINNHNVPPGSTATASLVDGKLEITDTSGAVRIESSTSKLLEIGAGNNWSTSSTDKTISFGNFTDGSAVINPTGDNQDFVFIYKDKEYKVTLAPGATLDNLISQINGHSEAGSLVQASFENGKFVLKGIDTDPETPNISDGSSGALAIARSSSAGYVNKEKNSVTDITLTSPGIVNSSTDTVKFTYTNNGITGSIDVKPGTTLEQFISQINNNPNMPGVYASAERVGTTDKYKFRLSSSDPSNPPIVSPSSSRDPNFAIKPPNSTFTDDLDVPVAIYGLPLKGTDIANTTDKDQMFMVEYQGKNISFKVKPGETVQDLIDNINNATDGQIKANLFTDADNNTKLQLWGTDPKDTRPPQVSISSSSDLLVKPPDIGSGDWYIQKNSNAEVKLNDWPAGDEWIESESNSPDELIDGITLTFKDVGTTQVTVSTDDVGIKEQIVAFVDALNGVRSLIRQMTVVDDDKDVGDIDKTPSAFDAQKGSILTGNYGVQLLSSMMRSATSSQAQGFQYQHEDADGLLTGDLFTSLAHVGITTVADENTGNFGLLTIDEKVLDAALAQDSQAVAELFAADNKASVSSSDISFSSYINGTTAPGAYEFNYTVNADGNILDSYVIYKGERYKANFDGETKQLTIAEGPGLGLAVNVNNMDPGSHTSMVTLKMGKIGELAAFTKEMNSEDGILNIIQRNYVDISDNIQKKIDREEERLVKWERNMKLKFARLEAVLAQYEGLKSQLESTIKTLPSD